MLPTLAILTLATQPLTVSDLKCEWVRSPLNVDVSQPRLSWIVSSSEEGQRQTAYRILAASTPAGLAAGHGDLWDTGRVAGPATIEVPYSGSALKSCEEVFWKVRVWDAHGKPSKWSDGNVWSMGLLNPSDWRASWITTSFHGIGGLGGGLTTLRLRKETQITQPVSRALCFVCGLGQYEMWINGERVGYDWLTPGWTEYGKTCLADCSDVTPLLRSGANSLAVLVGNGMYDMSGDTRGGQQTNKTGDKKLICQLMLWFRDGTRRTIVTDGSWRAEALPGPETYSGVFGGEDYDARREPIGWKLPKFDDHLWDLVNPVKPPTGVLRGLTHSAPPIIMQVGHIPDPSAQEPKPNIIVLDLGQNAPYVPQITVSGPAGATIELWPGEVLNPDGTVNQSTMRPGKHASYVLRGGHEETWHPSFWYVGSRYWEIRAYDQARHSIDPAPLLHKFMGLLVHAAVDTAGHFECSNKLLNQTHDLIRWAMLSNFASVISDCPHREKSGWLEQDFLMGPSLMYEFDMSTMFRKVIADMGDTQLPNGMVPTTAPEFFFYQGGFRDSVEWGGAFLLLPELTRAWYDDRRAVDANYGGMKRYVDYLGTRAKDGILSNGLGDWNGGGADPRTSVAITDTAYYFKLAATLADFAKSLGRSSDLAKYGALAEQIRAAFNKRFVDASTGQVGTGSQSAQATALDMGLIDPGLEQRAFDLMLKDVEAYNYAVSCGEIGHPALLRTLARFGRSDVVARIHLQADRPGYGYQIKKGLTTLAETWDASTWASYNHFMLGHLMEWLYADLVGIKPDPTGVAFSTIIFQPQPVPDVTWARATYDSARGRIACSWKEEGDRFHMEITVPANTSATVYVPCKDGAAVRISYPGSKAFSVFVGHRTAAGVEPVSVTSGRFIFDTVLK